MFFVTLFHGIKQEFESVDIANVSTAAAWDRGNIGELGANDRDVTTSRKTKPRRIRMEI